MAKETRIDTDNDNVKIVNRFSAGAFETLREVTTTTGEVQDNSNTEIRQTIEIITITRTIIQSI